MEDFNINEFAKMLDAALASDNPAVKKALRNFMLITAIVTADDTKAISNNGLFSGLIEEVKRLSAKVSQLEQRSMGRTTTTTSPYPYDTNRYPGTTPSWIYTSPTSISFPTISTTSVTGSTTTIPNVPGSSNNVSYDVADLSEMLKELDGKWKQT